MMLSQSTFKSFLSSFDDGACSKVDASSFLLCACCETVVASTDKDCPNCGSHNIRSPFGFWIFCIVACLAAAIIVKSVQVYLADRNSEPAAVTSLFDVLNHDNKPK
jgi:hypothetical protein